MGKFHTFARRVSDATGHPIVFCLCVAIIVTWLVSGPLFGFSEKWQLFINTTTTIITFLMVFLLQNTQNANTKALHLKIDELVMATEGARDEIVGIEKEEP